MLINVPSRELYVVNYGSETLSIISLDGLYVKRTILLDKKPLSLSHDDSGLIYVSLSNGDSISVIDRSKKGICEVKEEPVGRSPYGVVFEPGLKFVYVSNIDSNTISAIKPDILEGRKLCAAESAGTLSSVQVGINPVDVKLNPSSDKVYVLNRKSNNISVINITSRDPFSNVTEIPIKGGKISAMAVYNNTIYVANEKNDTVSVINGTDFKPISDPIPVGNSATAITVDDYTGTVYVANSGDDTVSVINGPDHKPIGNPILVGASPTAITVNPDNGTVYVANSGDDTVSILDPYTYEPIGDQIPVGASPTH